MRRQKYYTYVRGFYGYISRYGFCLSLYLKELEENVYCCKNVVFVAF